MKVERKLVHELNRLIQLSLLIFHDSPADETLRKSVVKTRVKGMASMKVQGMASMQAAVKRLKGECYMRSDMYVHVAPKEVVNARCSVSLVYILFAGAVNESQPYAVVCFDDGIGVVLWNHVTMVDSMDRGKKCRVLWSDGLRYDAVVIFKGATIN